MTIAGADSVTAVVRASSCRKMKVAELLNNALMRELLAVRIDTMWRMLRLQRDGRLPPVTAEGASGHLDNKGALFVPGGLVFRDSDRQRIRRKPAGMLDEQRFRRRVREAMRHDNATLMFHDGLVSGINLDNGFFADIASNILSSKQAALKRRPPYEAKPAQRIDTEQITRSHCPTYVPSPYGSRTRLSSCLSVCLMEARMYYIACRKEFGLRNDIEEQAVWESIRDSRKPITGEQSTTMAPPCIVVCHSTRYRERNLGGITRLLGYGKFGQFACLTLERLTSALANECESAGKPVANKHLVADFEGIKVAAVIRLYRPTKPGRRQKGTDTQLLAPGEDMGLDLERLAAEARKRYRINGAG